MSTTTETEQILAQLREVGERRSGANRHTLAGMQTLQQTTEDIRALGAEAARLGLSQRQMGEAVGVSRQWINNILTGKTGI